MNAADIINALGMSPHPEGGHYVETFRDERQQDGRSVGTAIYYLLEAGETSEWHRVDAAEIWHWYAGAPLLLKIAETPGSMAIEHRLGPDIMASERPQFVVKADYWQSARSLGEWSLVGCTVSPGFEFSGFEMATQGMFAKD